MASSTVPVRDPSENNEITPDPEIWTTQGRFVWNTDTGHYEYAGWAPTNAEVHEWAESEADPAR